MKDIDLQTTHLENENVLSYVIHKAKVLWCLAGEYEQYIHTKRDWQPDCAVWRSN